MQIVNGHTFLVANGGHGGFGVSARAPHNGGAGGVGDDGGGGGGRSTGGGSSGAGGVGIYSDGSLRPQEMEATEVTTLAVEEVPQVEEVEEGMGVAMVLIQNITECDSRNRWRRRRGCFFWK